LVGQDPVVAAEMIRASRGNSEESGRASVMGGK
jgi:hypothetical protein